MTKPDKRYRHGCAKKGDRTPEYEILAAMKARCRNPRNKEFARYGGRGIKVCERWERFENFLADMGPRPSPKHSIDRKDNNGDYEPGNCRWATATEQARNKRNNTRVAANGKLMTVREWAAETGIDRTTIYLRIKNGWSPSEAVSTPPFGVR